MKGFAQYETSQSAPNLTCAYIDYSADDYLTIAFVPEVVSSGNDVKPAMTVTVADLLAEWHYCEESGDMPKIANNVVRLLDVQVVDTLDVYGDKVKYLIQEGDTMELSNLWSKFGLQTFERNNIVGIADFYALNSNGIYQIQPLSQAHITDASLTPEVSTLEELQANEGTPVIVRNVESVRVPVSSYETYYFIFDEVVAYGLDIAGRFDVCGMYENGEFTVYELVAVHSFATIDDLNAYVVEFPDAANVAYDVYGHVLVTHVDGNNVFVQYDGLDLYGGSALKGTVLMGVTAEVEQGDLIEGIKGVSTPCVYHEENYNPVVDKGSSFVLAEDAQITVLSRENEIKYASANEYVYMNYNVVDAQGAAVKITPVGTISEKDGRYFYTEIGFTYDFELDQEIQVEYTLELVSSTVNLAEWIGADFKGFSIAGVLDYKNTSDDVKLYVHGLVSNTVECDNIADLIETADNGDIKMTHLITNPVVVTYVYTTEWSAGLALQDETGAIFLSYNNPETVAHVKIGDSVTGVKGTPSWGAGTSPALFGYDDNSG
ncbi:MAG: hypothetical protein J6V67_00800, partial [Campylobacter sp.]|uniref:hypothetical protein n=1 Tax=Campylobacter sp. TaxID=205 RepID=UPI001B2A239E